MTASACSTPDCGVARGWLSILTARRRLCARAGSARGSPLIGDRSPGRVLVVVVGGRVVLVVEVVVEEVVVGSAAGEQAARIRHSATTLRVRERIAGTLGTMRSVSGTRHPITSRWGRAVAG